ncbi:MAG: DUF3119 family protein [Cyanobacteriota bacterium]|nr:DUF3119 family protein [Cyanobacteriota bacterium]
MAITPPAESDAGDDGRVDGQTTLAPRFWVPLGLTLLAALVLTGTPRWPGAPWLGLAMLAFATFLLVQTTVLRLCFNDEALLVLRGGKEIRRFPFSDWLEWRIFWPAVPVLFYFRERNSPHLLPMLFDATALRAELEQRVPRPDSPEP